MSTSYIFDRPRLRPLVQLFLGTEDYDFEQSFPASFKKPLKLYFHEMIPMVQLGDGFNFIEAVFTKEAMNSFRKFNSHLCLMNMSDRLINVTKWALVVRQRPSMTCMNSSSNLAVYLVVYDFQPLPSYTALPRQASAAKNIFDDEMICTILKQQRFVFQKQLIKTKEDEGSKLGFGHLAMPSMLDLKRSAVEAPLQTQGFGGRNTQFAPGLCLHGLLRMNEDSTTQGNEETTWSQRMRDDEEDFTEFRTLFNEEEEGDDLTPQQLQQLTSLDNPMLALPAYYDVQRLLIQEKGDDRYNELHRKKLGKFLTHLSDKHRRACINLFVQHRPVSAKAKKEADAIKKIGA